MDPAIVSASIGLLLGAACVIAQGPLPGDVALVRSLQAIAGASPAWAALLTRTAKPPLVWATAGLAAALGFVRGGGRGAAAPPLTFLAAQLVDTVLRGAIFAPRPTPGLVAVVAPASGSGLPSTFALVYGALFGSVILTPRGRGTAPAIAAWVGVVLLAAGACARIVLAGHWPSQVLASLLVSFALAMAVQRVLRGVRGSRA
jgi:membrane-associated phospholipid phosphatase